METKEEDGDGQDEWPTSPMQALEDAVRVAGEALQSVYSGRSSLPPLSPGNPAHRRTRSEVVSSFLKRSNSFQRLKSHMQRALRLGSHSGEQSPSLPFNPEILANQKRQWCELKSKSLDYKSYKEPASLFEHFFIAGLHPDANLDVVGDAFARRRKWELEMEKSDILDFRVMKNRGPPVPSLEPQILFTYPSGKRLPLRFQDLAAFCFPSGVKAHLLKRTPSLSDLNALVYGQEHLSRDDLSFIFSLKVADNATLYGVCLHVQEFVQRAPAICGGLSPLSQSSVGCSRFLIAAPRCYCLLTRVPFFELHYEMLNSIIAQQRLNRITHFVTEASVSDYAPPASKYPCSNENSESPHSVTDGDWMATAIPVDCAIALTAAAAGIISDDEIPSSSSRWESYSPESVTASEASNHSQTRESNKDCGKNLYHLDDGSEPSENRSDFAERIHKIYENGSALEVGTCIGHRNQNWEHLESPESSFSSVRSIASEDDNDILFGNDMYAGEETATEWNKEKKNGLLHIVYNYDCRALPPRGSEIVFQPIEHLQAIQYSRLPVSALGISDGDLDLQMQDPKEAVQVNLKLAAAEEAAALSMWTTATICRILSLENILALLTGVLLEKQVVVVCPNLGVLSAVVLSLIPIIRPFQWQSLFLPILPDKMLDFLDAPVPFIVGVQHKPANLKTRTSSLVHVNVVKDQVKMCNLPVLPQRKELLSKLEPIHAILSCEDSIAQKHPVHKCNEVQAEAAAQFLEVIRQYLESLCSDLRTYSITNVQSDNDRVSILLKDSFIESFQSRDKPFVKLFVDTQLFSVLSDSRL
ncbi:hypothetical protein ACH5RR_020339 [Cinchona calisaya]|uniref:UDENN domain-containing protein n=1 Tax=Cinchona calisaya TaxID=153742 RepID=A0ABD2ZHH4_9GENT